MLRSFWTALAAVIVAGLAIGAGLGAATSRGPANNATVAAANNVNLGAASGASTRQGGAIDGAGARQGATGAEFVNRRTVAGTVEQVDGQKLTVKSETGPVQIGLSDQTTYRNIVKGGLDDLKAGETVVARTDAAADGAMVARSLQLGAPAGGQSAMFQLPGGAAGGPAGAAGGRRGDGAAAGAVRMTFGTIQTVDGKTITLTTSGGPVKLTVADGAEIQRSAAGTRDDLKPGQTVTVVGQADAAGGNASTAVSVTISGD